MVSKKISNLKLMVSAIDTKVGKLTHAREQMLSQIRDLERRATETVSHCPATDGNTRSTATFGAQSTSVSHPNVTGADEGSIIRTNQEGYADEMLVDLIDACHKFEPRSVEQASNRLAVVRDHLVEAHAISKRCRRYLAQSWTSVVSATVLFGDQASGLEATLEKLKDLAE